MCRVERSRRNRSGKIRSFSQEALVWPVPERTVLLDSAVRAKGLQMEETGGKQNTKTETFYFLILFTLTFSVCLLNKTSPESFHCQLE